MKLNHLIKGLEPLMIKGDRYIDIESISCNSKQLKASGLFFCIPGSTHNGYDFVDEAIERGAVAVIAEKDFITYKNVTKVIVRDIRQACALTACNFYSHPSRRMDITGITGTNGKTTTLYLISAIIRHSGRECGTIGTINYQIGSRLIPAVNTTPSSISLQMFLREMELSGIKACIMEVSSHALDQNRVYSTDFNRAVFTNLTSEHLDYHKDIESYFKAKSLLFSMLKEDGAAIINNDDGYGKLLAKDCKAKVLTYGIRDDADIKASGIKMSAEGISFKVSTPEGVFDIETPLIGDYNVYNILAGLSFAYSTGMDMDKARNAIKYFRGAPGRLQRVESERKGFSVFVDYAHTDDALSNVLSALKTIAKNRLIVVFGCGGNRDSGKRPRMARVSAELSDYVVVTNDNPRSEDPEEIVDDILKGFPGWFKDYRVCIDRKKAIEHAVSSAKKGDIVLIAGKGHENYQIFRDTVIPFDDKKTAEEILQGSGLTAEV